MMEFAISNRHITVTATNLGAELRSITGEDQTEYLWQGDPDIWAGRAPNLFPYIARLTNGEYTYKSKCYRLPIHGFANSSEFEIVEKTETKMIFSLNSNARTRLSYPFEFSFYITYEVVENTLIQTYAITNQSTDTMYFGVGAHPGFNVPLDASENFEDYYLEFEEPCSPIRIGFSEDCFLNGEDTPFHLTDGYKLELSHSLFDHDAIIFKNMSKTISLKSKSGQHDIRVSYPDMKYLGLWHMPQLPARYICIEPWSSLPSRKNITEDLEQQDNLLSLNAGGIYTTRITFDFV